VKHCANYVVLDIMPIHVYYIYALIRISCYYQRRGRPLEARAMMIPLSLIPPMVLRRLIEFPDFLIMVVPMLFMAYLFKGHVDVKKGRLSQRPEDRRSKDKLLLELFVEFALSVLLVKLAGKDYFLPGL